MKPLKQNILKAQPRILINADKKLVVFWSAKAGSTFILKWFLFHAGLLEQAKKHSSWIHDYRQTLYHSEKYLKTLNQPLEGWRKFRSLKLVRNPFSRAVSSYIHCLYMIKINIESAILLMTRNRSEKLKEKYSFAEFVERLEEVDIMKCNMHWRSQIHKAEIGKNFKLNFLVKLENAHNRLPKVENRLNLKPSNLSNFSKSIHHNQVKEGSSFEFIGNTPFDDSVRLDTPNYKGFYNKTLKQKIVKIYLKDFDQYHYKKFYNT